MFLIFFSARFLIFHILSYKLDDDDKIFGKLMKSYLLPPPGGLQQDVSENIHISSP